MSEPTKAYAYGGAALQALGFYIFLYVMVIHVFVALKWKTPGADSDFVVIEVVNPMPHEVAQFMAPNPNDSGLPSPNDVDELLHRISATTKAMNTSTTDDPKGITITGNGSAPAWGILGKYQTILSKWDKNDVHKKASLYASSNRSSSLLPEAGQWIENLPKLNNLLQRPALSDTNTSDDANLTSLIQSSLKELQALVDQKLDLRWQAIGVLLSLENHTFPLKKKLSSKELQEMVCPSPLSMITQEDPDEDGDAVFTTAANTSDELLLLQGNLSLYAQEDDLQAHFIIVESVLDQRMTYPQERFQNNSRVKSSIQEKQKILNDAFGDARSIVDATIEELSEAVALAASSEQNKQLINDDGCRSVTEDEVLAFMNAGLNAIKRHQELRNSLLRVLKELDSASAENLILDADLQTEAPAPQLSLPQEVNVRALCDTPLLRNLAAALDRFLDIIGGYNDSWDQYIDQLAERNVNIHNQDASSLGKVFVATLLARSGHARVPIPVPVLQFLSQTNGGRALLASVS